MAEPAPAPPPPRYCPPLLTESGVLGASGSVVHGTVVKSEMKANVFAGIVTFQVELSDSLIPKLEASKLKATVKNCPDVGKLFPIASSVKFSERVAKLPELIAVATKRLLPVLVRSVLQDSVVLLALEVGKNLSAGFSTKNKANNELLLISAGEPGVVASLSVNTLSRNHDTV